MPALVQFLVNDEPRRTEDGDELMKLDEGDELSFNIPEGKFPDEDIELTYRIESIWEEDED